MTRIPLSGTGRSARLPACLGNGRYVLVPHNERYPSMGADVLHLDALDLSLNVPGEEDFGTHWAAHFTGWSDNAIAAEGLRAVPISSSHTAGQEQQRRRGQDRELCDIPSRTV